MRVYFHHDPDLAVWKKVCEISSLIFERLRRAAALGKAA